MKEEVKEEYVSPEIKIYEIHPHPILCGSVPEDDWHHDHGHEHHHDEHWF